MKTRLTFTLFIMLSVMAFALAGCGSDDGDNDGDVTDGDIIDGDDTLDGDTTDGDQPVITDGDEEAEDPGLQMCQAEAGTACFDVDNEALAGPYSYGLPENWMRGCTLSDATGYKIEMYDMANVQSKLAIEITAYDEPRDYELPADDFQLLWALDNAGTPVNYFAIAPCVLSVTDSQNGEFDCLMQNPENATDNFRILGAWSCPAE